MICVGKTPANRPSRRPLPQRPKQLLTFHSGSERWICAVHGAINLLLKRTNAPKKRFSTGIFPGLRSLDSNLLNVLRIPRPLTSLGETIRTISAIEKVVVIMALVTQDFQVPPQPLRSIRPIPLLEITVTTTGHQSKRTKTWIKLTVIIITRKGILLTSAPSFTSQKTSIGPGKLHVGDCC